MLGIAWVDVRMMFCHTYSPLFELLDKISYVFASWEHELKLLLPTLDKIQALLTSYAVRLGKSRRRLTRLKTSLFLDCIYQRSFCCSLRGAFQVVMVNKASSEKLRFVYDGIPSWEGSLRSHVRELPVWRATSSVPPPGTDGDYCMWRCLH